MYSEHQKKLESKIEDSMIQTIAGTSVEINPEGNSL